MMTICGKKVILADESGTVTHSWNVCIIFATLRMLPWFTFDCFISPFKINELFFFYITALLSECYRVNSSNFTIKSQLIWIQKIENRKFHSHTYNTYMKVVFMKNESEISHLKIWDFIFSLKICSKFPSEFFACLLDVVFHSIFEIPLRLFRTDGNNLFGILISNTFSSGSNSLIWRDLMMQHIRAYITQLRTFELSN